MRLRDYQQLCHDAIFEKWKTHQSTLAVLATGLGKTIIFAHVIKSLYPLKVLVLAHRQELIWQARQKIEAVTELPVEIEMADLHSRGSLWSASTVVGSVQTMISGKDIKRMGKFKPEHFKAVIIDEGHHSTSKSYVQIINYFKQNPDIKFLGVTATPDRADKEALGQVFESVAFNYEILDGVENGWLVDVVQTFYQVESLDFSHCKTTAGDLNGADLEAVMIAEENVQKVTQATVEVMYGLPFDTLKSKSPTEWPAFLKGLNKTPRRTIVFTASVAHAEICCNIFNRVVPKIAGWVCAKTKDDDRKLLLEKFSDGRTSLVANCGVLTEGFDNPGVEVIIMARPTKSRSLYAQMVGRSTRPLPGLVDLCPDAVARKAAIAASAKPYCRIVDFVGNSGRHRLMTCMDILGGKVSDDVVQRAIEQGKEKAKDPEKPGSVLVCRELSKAEMKLEEERRERLDRARREEEARKQHLYARANGHHYDVNPFMRNHQGAYMEHVPSDRYLRRPLSIKQCRLLRREGYNPEKMTPAQGKMVIKMLFEAHPEWNKTKGTNETSHHHGSAGSLASEYLPSADESGNPF